MAFIPVYIFILLFTIGIDYIAGIQIEKSSGKRRKTFLILSIAANIGVLAFFKYYNFFIENINEVLAYLNIRQYPLKFLNIILPIGLSFHTFQAMAYNFEIYKGNFKAERHLGYYALYVLFYPQLVAGPIERPQNILPQFHIKHKYSQEAMITGLRLMLWGLFKKVVIADRFGAMADSVYNQLDLHTGMVYVLATLCFGIQIYCDFSGYSDIAIGSARTMGFKLMTNFNMPYFSRNISEFWSRWHISLSSWFRDYVYIPLGGNRKGRNRTILNLLLVFLLSGFWHGASWNFVIWGALHFGFTFAYNVFASKNQLPQFNLLNVLLTYTIVNFAWIFFRANGFSEAKTIISQLFSEHQAGGYFHLYNDDYHGNITYLGLPWWKFCLTIGLGFLFFIMEYLISKGIVVKINKSPIYLQWAVYMGLITSILVFGVFNTNQFIYFQF